MPITDQTLTTQYYQALLNKDANYIGIFFAAIKTTGIFCLPTCRARKPKYQNVLFYTTIKETLNAGFRPCKICQPTQNAYQMPAMVKNAIQLIQQHPKQKITDWQLKQHHIQPEKVRRYFKQHYGITFQAYHRMLRINTAYQELKQGNTITDTAFQSGYNSLSGFNYTYQKMTGKTPMQQLNLITMQRLTTPIGPMFVAASEQGICLLEFVDRPMFETELKDLQQKLKARVIIGENHYTQQTEQQLQEYFAGKRTEFTLPLHTPGTDFQQSVWQQLQTIPYGHTRSYKQQAIAINKPSAVRAVANANGANRLSIIIPCHRVIGSNGELTGYGGGLPRKKWLLDHEQKHLTK